MISDEISNSYLNWLFLMMGTEARFKERKNESTATNSYKGCSEWLNRQA
jgi:hypothetical protein